MATHVLRRKRQLAALRLLKQGVVDPVWFACALTKDMAAPLVISHGRHTTTAARLSYVSMNTQTAEQVKGKEVKVIEALLHRRASTATAAVHVEDSQVIRPRDANRARPLKS